MKNSKWSLIFVAIFLTTFPARAFNLGGLGKLQPPSIAGGTSPAATTTATAPVGKAPEKVADEVEAYVKAKFTAEGNMLRANLDQVTAYMKQKYGAPTGGQAGIYNDWLIPARGNECASMRFSFDGHHTSVTRSVGICDMID